MKTTKKQLKEIAEVEKKVSKVCDAKKDNVVFDEVTGIPYVESEIKPKKTIEVTKDDCNDLTDLLNSMERKVIHFKYLIDFLKLMQKSIKEISKEKVSREISLTLRFGKTEPHLGEQLEEQGFYKLSEYYIKQSELIRQDVLALNKIGILSRKQMFKCFKSFESLFSGKNTNKSFEKLSKIISRKVVNSEKLKSEFPKLED